MSAQPHDPAGDAQQPAGEPEQPEQGQDTAQQPDAPQDDAQPADETVAEPVQPAEADAETGKVIELRTERGFLALRPTQSNLDPEQKASLLAIGIDTENDPGVFPHLRAFIHMCQTRNLDPWAREAYLIGRGTGQYRKWTMQTGIDGYRKMAAATGRFIRVKDVLWTGSDDDDRSYVAVDDGHGGVVMRRKWYDQWPASRGNPGAAKVVIEHYDEAGNVVTTAAVADWGMYAPYSPKYTGPKGNRRKVLDDQGQEVLELNEMWSKGGPHMLAKCAEALAHRKAFPAAMSGIYTHEEMHRLDQAERERQQAEQRAARQRAYADAQRQQVAAHPQTVPGEVVPPAQDQQAAQRPEQPSGPLPMSDDDGEPVHVSETVDEAAEVVRERARQVERAHPEPSEDERAQWLRDEIDMLAQVLGQPTKALYQRQVRALRKNVDEFSADDLLRTVKALRPNGIAALARHGRTAEAEAYTQATQAQRVWPVPMLLGHADAAPEPEPEPDVDPHTAHAYVDHEGVCAVPGCDKFADDVIHDV